MQPSLGLPIIFFLSGGNLGILAEQPYRYFVGSYIRYLLRSSLERGDFSLIKNSNHKIFYGYIVVIASFFIIFVMHGMYSVYGVFFNPLQTEFGWSRTMLSGAHSLAFFLEGLFAIVVGRLTDRFGPKIIMVACGFVLGLGYSLMSQVNAVWQLYFFYGVIVGIGTGSGNVSLLSTTARWFIKRRGMMSGIVKVGTGAGLFITPLVATWLISSYGWRDSYVILGIISMLGIVSVAQFLRRDPSQKGLEPYGAHEQGASSSYLVSEGLPLREAIYTKQFWMVCAMYFIIWYFAMSMTLHIVPYALDLGVSAARAAGVLSTIGGISILGRVIMGGTGDRVGNRRALVICFLILIIALSWLQLAKGLWALYLFAAIYGFSHGGFFALVSPLVAELFGTRSLGVIFGTVLFITQIGGAIGPAVTGRIFDITRSYQLAFLILLVASVLGFMLSILLRPIRAKGEK